MAAKIATVFNQKGGCGKTMATIQVGSAIALQGKKVLVVDFDPQGTSSSWSNYAQRNTPLPVDVISLADMADDPDKKDALLVELQKYTDKYDLIIIDNPPNKNAAAPWVSLLISDLCIVPFIPAMDNIWAMNAAKNLVLKAQEVNPSLKMVYLASKVERTKMHKVCTQFIAADKEVRMLKGSLFSRTKYQESQIDGVTVHAYSVSSPEACETDDVAAEVMEILGIK